jgi:phosphoribosylamine--glycine ligase
MKLFVMDNDGDGVGIDLALRAKSADHSVRYWTPPKSGPYGEGLLVKVEEWEPLMDWADLIVLTGNAKYGGPLTKYFGEGYPIFGTNARAAELELDREVGQRTLDDCGVDTLAYHGVDDIDSAISLVTRTGEAYAIKPWGGEADKAMTCVARDADEAIFMLERWKSMGLKGKLMLQEKVEGIEVGISGFFGPGGWSVALEESFEHKKFMNDELGCNTGEMGTVIRHVSKSKLFDEILEPLTEYLHEINYIGDCNVNCIVDAAGKPWPLEFTMRLGWPDFCIRQSLIDGDPVEWMADLVHGTDSLEVFPDVAVGVLIAHGDFPTGHDPEGTWAGFPIDGVTAETRPHLHFQQVMKGIVPVLTDGRVRQVSRLLTAGSYVMIVSGTGETISAARKAAYETAWEIKMPSNVMFRTDIGAWLEDELPQLQKHGYCKGLEY